MNIIETKKVGENNVILFFDPVDGWWGIRDDESGDAQTYDCERAAVEDFYRIVDTKTLYDVFGWK